MTSFSHNFFSSSLLYLVGVPNLPPTGAWPFLVGTSLFRVRLFAGVDRNAVAAVGAVRTDTRSSARDEWIL